MGYYFLIGLIYTLINVLYRKVDTDGDWFLVLVWMTLWPLALLSLLVAFVLDQFKSKELENE